MLTIKSIIREKLRLLRFRLSSKNHPLFIGFYKYVYKPKHGSLEEILHEYSLSKVGAFSVIQIGANDGITHDPIHKFIKRDNWNGVLLEPQPYVYEHRLKKIYERNIGITTLCAAIGPKDGKQTLYKIGFSNMRWATGLASFQKESLEKAFSSGLVQAKCLKYNIEMPPSSARITSEEVLTISAETLLKTYNMSTIDLLQIDAEGYDYEVIRMFDIQKTQPRAIIFENAHLSESDMHACMEELRHNSYKVRHFGSNTLAMLEPLEGFSKFF